MPAKNGRAYHRKNGIVKYFYRNAIGMEFVKSLPWQNLTILILRMKKKPSETGPCSTSRATLFGTMIKYTTGDGDGLSQPGQSESVCDIACVRPFTPKLESVHVTSIFASQAETERGKDDEDIAKLAGDPRIVILPPRLPVPANFFELTHGIQHVIVGSSCRVLGMYAFAGSCIKEIDIPDTVTLIDAHCFENCWELQSVRMSNTGSNLRRIGDSAFMKCNALAVFDVPDSLEEIGAKCFWQCTSLKEFAIDKPNLRQIGIAAFFVSGLKSCYIPGTALFPARAFAYCRSLTHCLFAHDAKFTILPNAMFQACGSLLTMNVPDSVVVIGQDCFESCSSLVVVSFGSNSRLKRILRGAFSGTNITEIDLPDSLEEIEPWAFARCTRLARVGFGKESKLRTIAADAFHTCTSLTDLDDFSAQFRNALALSD